MAHERIKLGQKGEQLVAEYLTQKGYTICRSNYTRRCGEIDIIAEKDETRLFVEVKLRNKSYFATSQVVTPTKQRKIITTARYYNSENPPEKNMVYRFDIALLEPCRDDYTITYIPNAFNQTNEWS